MRNTPKLVKWVFSVSSLFLITMLLFRLVFYIIFQPNGSYFSIASFILGIHYDLRFAGIIGLGVLFLGSFPAFRPGKNSIANIFWGTLLPLLFLIMVFVYIVDFFHFEYIHERLNVTALNYIEDLSISFNMIWQTYPLIKVGIALVIFFLFTRFLFLKLMHSFFINDNNGIKNKIPIYTICFLFLSLIVYGKIGTKPLCWGDAFAKNSDLNANFALNPFQSFISTLNFDKSNFDEKKLKKDYPLMAAYLGIPGPNDTSINFERKYEAVKKDSINRPNIVLVICESFSAYKTSLYNNPLNTTPYFKTICDNGVFFNRCFSPAYGTPRGIWAILTGIPDVERPDIATRNPMAINQQTIINSFANYEKMYFLGGSASFGNLGALYNNIDHLKLYQEGSYTSPKVDVWGISDRSLFFEAGNILKKQEKPFFAIIQTADNHRPYTISKADQKGFEIKQYPKDSLKKYGFDNNDELNAFRFSDFCFQQFIESAKKEKYFDNTIFVFVGDHGIPGDAAATFPKCWTENGFTNFHVPLLFYAPKLLTPKKVDDVCSQIDILPSIAGIANQQYTNTTLGRNLFDTTNKIKNLAFITNTNNNTVGVISNEFCFQKNLHTGKEDFFSIINNDPIIFTNRTDSVKKYLSGMTNAFYQSSAYLLVNNKRK